MLIELEKGMLSEFTVVGSIYILPIFDDFNRTNYSFEALTLLNQ